MQGMQKLLDIAENLSSKFNTHAYVLQQAHNLTNDILDTLEETATSATALQGSLLQYGGSSWWPYIICPTVSLVMGSYGLPPSAFRNLGLFALGELAGWAVSSFDQLTTGFLSHREHGHTDDNMTISTT